MRMYIFIHVFKVLIHFKIIVDHSMYWNFSNINLLVNEILGNLHVFFVMIKTDH